MDAPKKDLIGWGGKEMVLCYIVYNWGRWNSHWNYMDDICMNGKKILYKAVAVLKC